MAPRGTVIGAWRLAALGALTVPWLTGCGYFGYPMFDDDFPEPSVIATYTQGSATLELADGTVIELPNVAKGSNLATPMGSSVRWTGGDGWHLRLNGAGGDEMFGEMSYLTFDRLTDGEHWTTEYAMDRCIVDIDLADATGVRGSATCKGVRWYDALDQSFSFEQGLPDPLDEPKFEAEVTFEALP
ncbi:MAG TPA: hypothetical protein VM344_01230 [Vitreimonas sp.]|nr:hypothetical protein [Vitreimonas sp.]